MKCTRIFLLIIAGFVFWSSNTYVSAKNASDDVAQHSNYNEIRQYYNLAQNRDEDGLLLEEKYRQVYPDVKNGEFNIYWGQPLDEISTVYELKWGVWSTNVGRYVLQLNKIYKRSSPYLILWFNKEKLYKPGCGIMTVNLKKALILNLPYLLFVYLFDKLCQAVRLAPGLNASEKFLHLSQGFTEAFSYAAPSLHPLDLLVGIAGAVIVRLAVYAKGKNARKYRKGIEYGSARCLADPKRC